MTIKQHGGIFGRNPSFNDVSVETLSIAGTALSSTTAELNILDGVTATTAELNILDGVTATTAELNILDGVTATTAELNILDGVTADATELNYLDGASTSVVTASKAVLANASANIAFASGNGIDFSADGQAAGMTSELLDDYEEGAFTPAFTTGTFTFTNQKGFYTKVGRQVTCSVYVSWGAISGNGTPGITLPFTAQATDSRFSGSLGYLKNIDSGGDKQLVLLMENNTNYGVLFWLNDNGTPTLTDIADWGADGVIVFAITYFV
jgi:hypothetical protein